MTPYIFTQDELSVSSRRIASLEENESRLDRENAILLQKVCPTLSYFWLSFWAFSGLRHCYKTARNYTGCGVVVPWCDCPWLVYRCRSSSCVLPDTLCSCITILWFPPLISSKVETGQDQIDALLGGQGEMAKAAEMMREKMAEVKEKCRGLEDDKKSMQEQEKVLKQLVRLLRQQQKQLQEKQQLQQQHQGQQQQLQVTGW